MHGAVKRFGLMPYQEFSKKDINLISDYLYDYKIDEPDWFKTHLKNENNGKWKMKYFNEQNN